MKIIIKKKKKAKEEIYVKERKLACSDGIFVQSLRFIFISFWVYTGYIGNITPHRLEKYHTKTCVMLERLKEKKKYRLLHIKRDWSEFWRQYSYSYISVQT